MCHPEKNANPVVWMVTLLAFLLVACNVASAQIYTDLYNFNNTSGTSPSYPQVLAQGRDGNLYGTAREGGASGGGTAFSVTPYGVLTVIHNFSGSDGFGPYAGLTLGLDGNFYGTTFLGGSNNMGEIFQLTPEGLVFVLHSFAGGSDGAYPYAPPVLGNDGSLYGLTKYSTAYKITTGGAFTVLGTIPGQSYAPLILGVDGAFYGTTQYGGKFNQGTVFRMTPAGVVTVIYNFDSTHGGVPWGGVVQAGGNFYGTTTGGGSGGGGVVYRLTPAGNFTVIHNFPVGSLNDGSDPIAGLLFGTDGLFYGSTFYGGSNNYGILFEIDASGQHYSLINQFDKVTGSYPESNLVQHTNGSAYGMALAGGSLGDGVFFSLDLNFGAKVKTVLSSGVVGSLVEILGSGFTGATSVNFTGASVAPHVDSDTYLVARVPTGALTGPLTVTTPSGTIPSMTKFLVVPKISSFSPTSGPVGTSVIITGNSFTGASKVSFGGVAATTFSVFRDSSLTATVPTGAGTGRISITTPGGTATSSGTFTVTP
jgi:uncharacterized repeat protein (TIGR03803 family)